MKYMLLRDLASNSLASCTAQQLGEATESIKLELIPHDWMFGF